MSSASLGESHHINVVTIDRTSSIAPLAVTIRPVLFSTSVCRLNNDVSAVFTSVHLEVAKGRCQYMLITYTHAETLHASRNIDGADGQHHYSHAVYDPLRQCHTEHHPRRRCLNRRSSSLLTSTPVARATVARPDSSNVPAIVRG